MKLPGNTRNGDGGNIRVFGILDNVIFQIKGAKNKTKSIPNSEIQKIIDR